MIDLDSAHDCADEFTCAVPIEPFEAPSLERERTARRNSRARLCPRANVKILVRLASNYMLPISVGNPTEDLSVAPPPYRAREKEMTILDRKSTRLNSS